LELQEVREVPVLLVIDAQLGFLTGPPPAFQKDRFLNVVARLQQRARALRVPVVLTQFEGSAGEPTQPGTPGFQIHPRLAPLIGEHVVRKRSQDSFYRSQLHEILIALGATTLYVGGCFTELCVDTTVRRAISLDYDVVVVEDAHTTVEASAPGLPDPQSRLLWSNHVLARVASEDRTVRVQPSATVDFRAGLAGDMTVPSLASGPGSIASAPAGD
jgi:hypothetical protein